MKPAESAYTKLFQANEHLQSLKLEIRAFLERDPYNIVAEPNNERSAYVWRVHIREEPLPTLSLVVGDCIHNLRSSLDHLVFDLAGRPKGRTAGKLEFPIHTTSEGYLMGAKEKLAGVAGEAQTIIQGLQPYHREGQMFSFEPHPLDVLRRLSNIDKHRSLHLVWFMATQSDVHASAPATSTDFHSGALVDKAVIASIQFAEPDVEVQARFKLLVALDLDRPAMPIPVLEYLKYLNDFIRFDVLLPLRSFAIR